MLSIDQIKKFYPSNMHKYERQILREYLQYLILDIIYTSEYADKIVFMGGTAIRIIHDSQRFSEDLDFDSRDLDKKDFENISNHVSTELKNEGFSVEIRVIKDSAFHCYLKFPGLLFDFNLSGYRNEKILMNLDAEKQPFRYMPAHVMINRFGILSRIAVVPKEIILSQKISAFLDRKRTKARDIFDIVYMYSFTSPDYDYLKVTENIDNMHFLIKILLKKSEQLDLSALSREIEPFLVNPKDKKVIEMFPDFINSIKQ